GILTTLFSPGLWNVCFPEQKELNFDFKPYKEGDSLVPVLQVTPENGFYIHSFYDICPWSPNGRFLVVNKLPYQGKKPQLGDKAEICIIDLNRQTVRTIYQTKAWSFQVGANAQWDAISNKYIYTNDLINNQPVCVRIDITNNEVVAFAGP